MKWTPYYDADASTYNRPDDGQRCMVITESGDERELIFDRGLWYLPDRSMYVYFQPVFWRWFNPREDS